MESFILDNGIKCILHPMPNTHSITIGLYIKAGVGYAEPLNGITHLLEHLHFRQLGNMTQGDLYYRMERSGSTLRATTYRDLLKFTMKIAPAYFDEALDIFASLINAVEWHADCFLKEKQVVLNQISECGSYVSIDDEARACIFRNHPLGNSIMGLPEDVEAIELEDVINYKKLIFNSENVYFCVTGRFTSANKDKMICRLLSCRLMPCLQLPKLEYPAIFHCRKPDVVFKYVNDNTPLDVNISFDIDYGEEDFLLITVLNCILGEGVGSRLQRLIREEKCYSTNIESYVEWYQNFAILHIRFSVQKENLYACLEDIVYVIQELKRNVTNKDLDVSLPFYTTNQVFYEDDTEQMNFQIAYHQLCLNRMYHVPSIPNNEQTCRSLQHIGAKIFREKNCSIVVVGNTKGLLKKNVQQILKKTGDGSVC